MSVYEPTLATDITITPHGCSLMEIGETYVVSVRSFSEIEKLVFTPIILSRKVK